MPDGVDHYVGGAALNLATGLQSLGLPTTLIAQVGSDEGGQLIKDHLDARNVALAAIAAPLGTGVARSDRRHGEPTYSFNDAMQGRSYTFGDAEIDVVRAATLVVVNSFPVDRPGQVDVLAKLLDESTGFSAYDPNPRPGMIESRDQFVRGFDRIAAQVTLVKISDEDASWMFGTSLDSAVDRVLELGTGIVLATGGRSGASIATAGGVRVSRPIVDLPGPIVDTMGAGDATLASLLSRIAEFGPRLPAEEWEVHLDFAMEVAALTCRSVGADIQLPPVR
jgi:fructokinase